MKHIITKNFTCITSFRKRKIGKKVLLTIGLCLLFGVLKAQNTKYGTGALNSNSTGTNNSAFGYQALYGNTYGKENTAVGSQALRYNITGTNNTAVGYKSLSLSGGHGNTAVGHISLYKNNLGSGNTAVGAGALSNNYNGSGNTALGGMALGFNTDGEENTATGDLALHSNTNGSWNTANGSSALYFNMTGNYNVAIGYYALEDNQSGNNNTAVGTEALQSSVGSDNVGVGYRALNDNRNSGNTAVGSGALRYNSSGSANTAVGYLSLGKNMDGTRNMANGSFALQENTYGSRNSAAGFCALQYNITGSYNAAGGTYALLKNTEGSQNTAFGYNALQLNATGSYNTALGAGADVTLNNLSNATAIGYQAKVGVSNTIVIGNTSITKISGKVSWSTLSDARFKKDVKQNVHGLDFILQLKPVTYNMDVKKLNTFLGVDQRRDDEQEDAALKQIEEEAIRQKEAIRYTGFLAQDVEQAAKAVNYDFSGVQKPAHEKDHYSLSYGDFVVPLVKAVQEQQQMIEAQKVMNEQLRQEVAELKKTIAVLTGSSSFGAASEQGTASENVKVYPNPSKGVFTVAVERPGQGTLEVYDFSGNKVQNLALQSNVSEYKIDLSGKQKGIYTVQIVSEGRKTTKRIVLE